MKNNKLKNCFVGVFHFIFGQIAYCSEQAKEANLKESVEITIWSQFKVLIAIHRIDKRKTFVFARHYRN